MEPKVSYVLPTYNRVEWVGECLQGLLSQTVPEIEVIAVDDGSNDGTDELLDWFAKKDPRVRVIVNPKNMGAGMSRNAGNAAAMAPIIAVCDSDDCYVTERTEKILEFFKANPEAQMVNFPYVRVNYFNEVKEHFAGCAFDEAAFKERGEVNYFSHPTCAYLKSAIDEIGGYDAETKEATDDYLLVKKWIGAGKKIGFMPNDYVCLHRVLPNSIMAQKRGFRQEWAI